MESKIKDVLKMTVGGEREGSSTVLSSHYIKKDILLLHLFSCYIILCTVGTDFGGKEMLLLKRYSPL